MSNTDAYAGAGDNSGAVSSGLLSGGILGTAMTLVTGGLLL